VTVPLARPTLRVCLDDVPDEPAVDTAVARVLLERVEAGELPATLRLSRPSRVVAFSARDTRTPGVDAAVRAATNRGFASVSRLAGGRPAVFTPATVAFSLAEPATTPSAAIEARFARMAGALTAALRALGTDARIGEVPGEYCPGAWSVNIAGTHKVAGIGQRVLRRSAHTGGVVVVGDARAIRDVLTDVYAAMHLGWSPDTAGAVDDVVHVGFTAVRDAIVAAFADDHDLEAWTLDQATLARARRRAAEHHLADAAPRTPQD